MANLTFLTLKAVAPPIVLPARRTAAVDGERQRFVLAEVVIKRSLGRGVERLRVGLAPASGSVTFFVSSTISSRYFW